MPTSLENLKRTATPLAESIPFESLDYDFAKPPSFQKWTGYDDVKSAPVYCYVQWNSNRFYLQYDKCFYSVSYFPLNIGNAMNLTKGKFMAPVQGTYFFSLTEHAQLPTSSSLQG
ncbi:hypothetical protein DAPPUDRAFT_325978 [Daphnia pulex]|uniref:Uncharacterized protein n=1 Tax=Daphnia pulex TaxID=6669 RepID=E9H6C4_DAPPU|nr:hypothetical protein DAPPUDRAFT_325978 [Daphnia pulex]|eukprot:EFX72722.1 hypothetical protein DAPPUDRAFT_325978 [Daphnia pulex]